MVTLRRFEQFIAVAEELSFTKAAMRLHMAQPPLTDAILKLEEDLGTSLFLRHGRSVELTAVGKIFLEEAKLAVNQVKHAVTVVRAANCGMIGTLRIGYTTSTSYEFMPKLLRVYRKSYPEVQISLHEYATWDQIKWLCSKELDIGLLRPPQSWPTNIYHQPLIRERLVALLPKSHPLCKKRQLVLPDLRNEPIVLYPPRWANRHHDQIIGACAEAGFTPHIVQEADGMLATVSFVAAGVGIGFGPRSLQNIRQQDIVFREFADKSDRLYFDLVIAWHGERQTLTVQKFINVASQIAMVTND